MTRMVAFDPGLTTGFIDVDVSDDGGFRVVKSCEIAWSSRFSIGELLQWNEVVPQPSAIVVEKFTLYAHRSKDQIGSDFPSAQVIGIIETYAHQLGLLDVVHYQMASVMSMVRILPEHYPYLIKSEHARDAYKHMRYFIVTR